MQVVRKDIDALNITVQITLEPADYKPKYEQELKKYKNSAQIKGFRKGMVPMPTLKKMYGKAIISDVINETLQNSLFDYLDKEELSYLGQPLANKESNIITDLDVDATQSYPFTFDIGLSPKLDIKGISATDSYRLYDVQVPDALIEDEVTASRRRFGKRSEATDTIQAMDMVKMDADEKDGTWKTDFSVLVDIIKDEKVKNELLTKKVGDTIEFDIYALEDKGDVNTEKYLLKRPEGDETVIGKIFVGTITEVSRIEPAAFDQEFFDNFGDPSITDETSLKDFFKKDLKTYYDEQARQYMNREIMDVLMDGNEVPLPDEFLKRYLKETNENVSDEDIEKEYTAFRTNMKWSLQKSHIAKQNEITVTEEDLRKHFTNSVFSYMRNYGNMDYSFISGTVDRLMKDKDQVNKAYEEILANKVFEVIGKTVKTNPETLTVDEFVEKVKALNEKINNL